MQHFEIFAAGTSCDGAMYLRVMQDNETKGAAIEPRETRVPRIAHDVAGRMGARCW